MERWIPYEKLSKKKQRALNAKKRGSWHGVNPVTRKTKNLKAYDRKRHAKRIDDPFDVSFLLRIILRKAADPGFFSKASAHFDQNTHGGRGCKKRKPERIFTFRLQGNGFAFSQRLNTFAAAMAIRSNGNKK